MDHVKHLITTDCTKQIIKPDKSQIGSISNSLRIVKEVDVETLAEMVTLPNAYTFSPTNFNGQTRKNSNFVSQSVFALDFDSGISPDDVLKRFQKYKIIPNFYYTTFSDTPETRKFRLVLFLDQVIKDNKQRDWIAKSLIKLFPEADKSCKDASRMFFGGKQSRILNKESIPLKSLIEVLEINNISQDGGQTRSLARTDQVFGSCRKVGIPLLYNKGLTESLQKYNDNEFDFDRAISQINILHDFADGKWLYHKELFGIATNLIWVRGGVSWMKQRMLQFNMDNSGKYHEGEEIQYSENNFNILPYVKYRNYYPQRLSEFSPHEQDHDLHNIITSVTGKRGHIETLETIEKKTLIEAEQNFIGKYDQAIHSDDNNIYIFRLPTGLGKTQKLTMCNDQCLIAVPTHNLKDEIFSRMTFDCKKTVKLPEFSNDKLNKLIHYYYSVGAHKRVHSLLKSISEDVNNEFNEEEDANKATNYIDSTRNLLSNYRGTVITTHHRAILNRFKHRTLIFDEDPLNSLFILSSFKASEMFKLSLFGNNMNDVVEDIRESKSGMIHQTPTYSFDFDEILEAAVENNIESNVLDFFQSRYYMKDEHDKNTVHYIMYRDLPADKKIIILSATVPVEIYRLMYGERIKVVDISDVEMKGEVIQNTHRSFSRDSLKRDLAAITQRVGDMDVITFASYKYNFTNPVKEMHFGNCSGYDNLKGKNLAVVGTPHQPSYKYLLLAKVLGIEFTVTDIIMDNHKVDWNGFRFMFRTFENDQLQKIQLSLIESELIQAVGRNRPLRENVTTHLYSNLPLKLVSQFINEKVEYKSAC